MGHPTRQEQKPKSTKPKFIAGLLGAGIGLLSGTAFGTVLSFHEFPYAVDYPGYAIGFGALVGAEPGVIIGFGIGWYMGSKQDKNL